MRICPGMIMLSIALLILVQQRVPFAAPEDEQGDRDERGIAVGGKNQRSIESSPLEFASFEPAAMMNRPNAWLGETAGCVRAPGKRPVPSVVHQIWLGGWKPMYAKLLSVLSVHFLLRPKKHVLLYDVIPCWGSNPGDPSMNLK